MVDLTKRKFLFLAPSVVAAGSLMPISVRAMEFILPKPPIELPALNAWKQYVESLGHEWKPWIPYDPLARQTFFYPPISARELYEDMKRLHDYEEAALERAGWYHDIKVPYPKELLDDPAVKDFIIHRILARTRILRKSCTTGTRPDPETALDSLSR